MGLAWQKQHGCCSWGCGRVGLQLGVNTKEFPRMLAANTKFFYKNKSLLCVIYVLPCSSE